MPSLLAARESAVGSVGGLLAKGRAICHWGLLVDEAHIPPIALPPTNGPAPRRAMPPIPGKFSSVPQRARWEWVWERVGHARNEPGASEGAKKDH